MWHLIPPANTRTYSQKATHKTLKSVLKTQSSTSVQSVCLVWDQSHASHIPLNTRPPSWHRYRPPPLSAPTVLKITPTKHTAVPAEILIKSFTSLTPATFSSTRLFLPALLVTSPFGDVISRWFADGTHLFCYVMKIQTDRMLPYRSGRIFILIQKVLIQLSMSDVGLWSVSQYRVSRTGIWE